MITHKVTPNFTSNPASVKIKAGKQELVHAFLDACSETNPIAPTRRRQLLLNVSDLKFPGHLIPVAAGTATIPSSRSSVRHYSQRNGLDMNELVQVAQDTHGIPYTIETQSYYRQEYNPLINQITTTLLEYPTLLPCDQTSDAPRWVLDQSIFGYFVLNPFTFTFDPLGHQAFVNKAAKNEPRFDSKKRRPSLQRNKDGWQVRSESDPNTMHEITFTVSPFGITYYCTCKGATYRRKCWHIEQARKLGEKDKRVQQALEEAWKMEVSWPQDSDWGW